MIGARAIVLDIEGTTTPVGFVYDVLFPFARSNVRAFLEREWNTESCRQAVALMRAESERPDPFGPADAADLVSSLMDRDAKSTGLKALQGLIWQAGYRSGELKGEVYPDVPPALVRWKTRGIARYIYSSGSVLAQRLLFGSTAAGDLTAFLDGYFDTAVGPKRSASSYRAIVARTATESGETLFVSDIVEELDAAREAGLQTALCVRAGTADSTSHAVIRTFDELP